MKQTIKRLKHNKAESNFVPHDAASLQLKLTKNQFKLRLNRTKAWLNLIRKQCNNILKINYKAI